MKRSKKNKIAKKVQKKLAERQKEESERRKKEVSYYLQKEIATLKTSYVTDILTFKFFLARSNMMAKQITSRKIVEDVDGKVKSMEYMQAEFMLSKMRARKCHMGAYFKKLALLKHGITEEEINAFVEEQYTLPIINDSYEGEHDRTIGKAEFVK